MSDLEFSPLDAYLGPHAHEVEPLRKPGQGYLMFGVIMILAGFILPIILPLTNPKSDLLEFPALLAAETVVLIGVGGYVVVHNLQMNRGVALYIVTGVSLVIQHAVGSTTIPFYGIKAVSEGSLVAKFREVSTKKGVRREEYYEDQEGGRVDVRSGALPYCSAPLVTCSGGKCILVKLKNGSTKALTPEEPEAMARALEERLKNKEIFHQ